MVSERAYVIVIFVVHKRSHEAHLEEILLRVDHSSTEAVVFILRLHDGDRVMCEWRRVDILRIQLCLEHDVHEVLNIDLLTTITAESIANLKHKADLVLIHLLF